MSLLEIAYNNTKGVGSITDINKYLYQKEEGTLYISDVSFTVDLDDSVESHFTIEYSGDIGREETAEITLSELKSTVFENPGKEKEITEFLKEMADVN